MSILISLLLIVEVFSAFLLIVVILAQKSKDQGLGMAFGSGMGESLFGSRAGNVLTRMTITLATVFMVATIFLGILFARGKTGGTGSIMEKAGSLPVAPAAAPMGAPQSAAPMMPAEAPTMPAAEAPSAPATLQMGENGELAPAQAPAPAAEETAAPAETPAAPAPETEPAPQN